MALPILPKDSTVVLDEVRYVMQSQLALFHSSPLLWQILVCDFSSVAAQHVCERCCKFKSKTDLCRFRNKGILQYVHLRIWICNLIYLSTFMIEWADFICLISFINALHNLLTITLHATGYRTFYLPRQELSKQVLMQCSFQVSTSYRCPKCKND